ncbi:GTA head formation protein, RCAP_rcc01685 family [Meridianimarinicoccus roseus]|jgi:hypothetical protein|uniref:GTA head formation protein, RCAP_rcc01685 family n=1 Tax=Meridianimarinicoccus roseus TaxID=2072018 RepID=UPI001EE645B6|nr:hypothetical protein [Meridianimarinicoccus roseus]
MSDLRRAPGGSRFLYEPFDYGPAQVREAHEKLLQMQFEGIDGRLTRIEAVMERLERRLWLTVYGVVATILAQAVGSLVTVAPNGGI